MKDNKQLLEIKLQLKKWEIKFVKENGCKPTKKDILNDKQIEKTYEKYYRLVQKILFVFFEKLERLLLINLLTNS